MRAKIILLTAIAILLGGCAAKRPETQWHKPASSAQEFAADKFACLQQSQQQTSGAYLGGNRAGAYGNVAGAAYSGAVTNEAMFSACMQSKGWFEEIKPTPAELEQARIRLSAIEKERAEVCSKPEFRPYTEKALCGASPDKAAKLNDASKITAEQAAVATRYFAEADALEAKYHAEIMKFGDGSSKTISYLIRKEIRPLQLQNRSDLLNGQQTWGQFNQRAEKIGMDAGKIIEKYGTPQ